MGNRTLYLIGAICIAFLNGIWLLLPFHANIIGLLLALPLVFLLSGYTLTEALFPEHAMLISLPNNRQFTTSSRLTFSIGLSLVIDVLGGFLLNFLPEGLNAFSWAIFLTFLTTVFACIAIYRGKELNLPGQSIQKSKVTQRTRFPFLAGVLFFLSLLLVLWSVFYSFDSARNQPFPGFTQFWLLPTPANESSCTIKIGIQSFELVSVNYHVKMALDGAPFKTWSDISIGYQQTWEQSIQLTIPANTTSMEVSAELYQQNHPDTIYRQVHMKLHITPNNNKEGGMSCTT